MAGGNSVINLRLLKFLEEVANAGSIRKAAARLNISSSAINRHVLALEAQLGTPLFERLPKRMRLTASGEVLIAYAQTMTKEHQRMLGRIAALKGMERGEIRIATMGGLINSPMLMLANDFVEQHSRVLVRIDVLFEADTIMGRVQSGECDIGLAYNLIPNPAIRVMQSIDVEVGLVVSPDHPLKKVRKLQLAHCLDYPLVTGPSKTVIRDVVEYAFASADLPMQPTVETNSIEVMKQFAIAGHCVTFLNPLDISAEIDRGELVCLRLEHQHFPTPNLKLIVRAKGALEAAAGRLAEEIKNRMAELGSKPGARAKSR